MAVYVGVFGANPGYILAASFMNAPAALAVSKMLIPELDVPQTGGTVKVSDLCSKDNGLIESLANGALDGLKLTMSVAAILLAFGRGIGDAASVLFTAGYTDRLPTSLMRPAASLPLAVFFQLGTPYPEVQQRGYASALLLTIIVLLVSFGSRWISSRLSKYTVK